MMCATKVACDFTIGYRLVMKVSVRGTNEKRSTTLQLVFIYGID